MAKMLPLMIMMKPAMPVSLMELLAIPLGCQRTTTKWLVITPALMELLIGLLMKPLAIPLCHQKTVAKRLVIAI